MTDDVSVITRPSRAPDQVARYGTDPDHIADVRFGTAGAGERPLIFIIHGGFWRPRYDRTHTGPMAEAIADAGFTVVSTEYRRVPGDPDKTLEDVTVALTVLPPQI